MVVALNPRIMMNTHTLLALVSFVGVSFAASNALASCGVGDSDAKLAAHSEQGCPISCEKDCCADTGHALTGKVVSINADRHMVVVKHEEIDGVMGAMTMGFAVPEDYNLANLKKGDQINARLVRDDNGYMIKFITVVAPEA